MAPDTPEVRAFLENKSRLKLSELEMNGIDIYSKMPNSNKTYYQYWTDYYKPRSIPPMVVEGIISSIQPVSGNSPGTLLYSCDGIDIVTNLDGKVLTVINSHPKGSTSFKD